jgi:putative nucleotidyltransferase with HDIG domain
MVLDKEYNVFLQPGVTEGMFCLANNTIDVVLLDIKMKKIDGISALGMIKSSYPLVEVIMITAFASVDKVQRSMRLGAADFICKPFDKDELRETIAKAIRRRDERIAEHSEKARIEEEAFCLRHQINKARSKVYEALEHSFSAILMIINSKDKYTLGHSARASAIATDIAGEMGINGIGLEWLRCASTLHDIGKILLPDEILMNRKEIFSAQELTEIQKHSQLSAEILNNMPSMTKIVPIVLHHHEWYNGSGYPHKLTGDEIPLGARILSVADTVDSMLNARYKRLLTVDQIKDELIAHAGSQFDPAIIDAALNMNINFSARRN